MLPLKEFAYFITLNTADLAETYIRLLHETGKGYEKISADSCRTSARKLIQAVAEACESDSSVPLSLLFDPHTGVSQRWAGVQLFLPQPLFELECLGRTLTPVVTSLDAGKFLWQMLAEIRCAVLEASELTSSATSVSFAAAKGPDPAKGLEHFQDLSIQGQSEEILQRLRQAVDQALDGLAIADLNGLVEFVNPAWASMHGYEVEELIGQPLSLFHTAEQLQTEVEPFNARVMAQGKHQGEMGHARRDGSTFPALMSVIQVKDSTGKPIGLLAACQDITERKRIETALAKQASELQAVAQISATISSILDSQQLLQEVVDLTKNYFDLYHAHIYLLNESGENLVLAAGAGQVGQKMATEGWQIPLTQEQSLVARASQKRRGVVSNDVRTEPAFLPNPALPETRSEMAIPLLAGETLLGVLDVQSSLVERFTEEDLQVMMTLAAQVTTALQNARLFSQTQSALADLKQYMTERESLLAEMEHLVRREQIIRQITEKMRGAPNLDLLAKIVAEELGKALGVSHSLVQIGASVRPSLSTSSKSSNGQNGHG